MLAEISYVYAIKMMFHPAEIAGEKASPLQKKEPLGTLTAAVPHIQAFVLPPGRQAGCGLWQRGDPTAFDRAAELRKRQL